MDISTKTVPNWERAPATIDPPKGVDDFISRSNAYFAECVDTDTRPTVTGYALAVGLPGPTSLIRLGQRLPELRYSISRCLAAIAKGYEDMIGSGNAAGPLFMLKNIPDFDPDEPIGAPAVQFFNERKEVLLQSNVVGAARGDSEFDKEDPLTTYLRLIRQRGAVEANTQITITNSSPKQRRSLTIITEGWDDEL